LNKFVIINVSGGNEIQLMLKNLPLKIQKQLTRSSMRRSLRILKQAAQRNLKNKSLHPYATGLLASKLEIRSASRKRGVFGASVITPKRGNLYKAAMKKGPGWKHFGQALTTAFAKGYYPAHVELGTSKMPAHPYLRPSLKENKQNIINMFLDDLKWLIVKENRKKI